MYNRREFAKVPRLSHAERHFSVLLVPQRLEQFLILRITRHFAICELLGERFICLLPIWPQQLLTLGTLNMLEALRCCISKLTIATSKWSI
jgi:hypothetical protein